MNFVWNLVSYLDGDIVEDEFVDRCLKNRHSSRIPLYRAILAKEGSVQVGQIKKISRRRICSASMCVEAAQEACLSYANDYEKKTKGKEIVVLQIDSPTICLSHKVLLRIVGSLMRRSLNYKLLKKEKEVIVCGNQYGRVISVRKF